MSSSNTKIPKRKKFVVAGGPHVKCDGHGSCAGTWVHDKEEEVAREISDINSIISLCTVTFDPWDSYAARHDIGSAARSMRARIARNI